MGEQKELDREKVMEILLRNKFQEFGDRTYDRIHFTMLDVVNMLKGYEAEWIDVDDEQDAFDCSCCGAMVARKCLYCPGCGARMKNGTLDQEKVMSWLEGLSQDDWHSFHSDSEVSNIAKAALDLLKKQEAWAKENRKHVCASCKNNADNLANGTRCPIQEHYGLPKDGFCHLWEGEENAESTL